MVSPLLPSFPVVMIDRDGDRQTVQTAEGYWQAIWEGYKVEGTFTPNPSPAHLTRGELDALVAAEVEQSGSATNTALAAAVGAEVATPTSPVRTALDAAYATSAEIGTAYGLATKGWPFQKRPVAAMIANLGKTGHGWTAYNSPASSNMNDTADFVIGTQSAKITTTGTGATQGFTKSGLAVNMTGKALRIWIKYDALSSFGFIQVRLGTGGFANYYNAAIFSPNGLSADRLNIRPGEWAAVDIGWGDFTTSGTPDRANITDIRVLVNDVGGGNAATVHFNGIAAISEQTRFPNGVVTFGFDDLYISQYTMARSKLDEYGYSGTLYPICDRPGTAGYMTMQQIQDLQNLNGWDIGGHASTAASHAQGLVAMTPEQRVAEMEAIRAWMKTNNLRGDSFATPLVQTNTAVEAVIGNYFRSNRNGYVYSGETLPPSSPYRVRSIHTDQQTFTSGMKPYVDKIIASKGWLNILCHDIVTGTPTGGTNQINQAEFNALVDYVAAAGMTCLTASQVMELGVIQ